MKKYVLAMLLAGSVVLEGCAIGSAPSVEGVNLTDGASDENVEQGNDTEAGDDAVSADDTAAEDSAVTDESVDGDYEQFTKDYTDDIKTKVTEITTSSNSLTDELTSIVALYDEYDSLSTNAPDQTAMNEVCGWGTVVWKEECLNLLGRMETSDPAGYQDVKSEYDNWEKYVPAMAQKMSDRYADGSIYPVIYSYNTAMRYKRYAYILASSLADIQGEVTFSFPDSTMCGYYGDYSSDSYLIITEGMESGSYDIVIHIDDTKEIRGWGSVDENSDGSEVMAFTSDDAAVEGTIDCFALGATFYVSASDGSIVSQEESYDFTFKY